MKKNLFTTAVSLVLCLTLMMTAMVFHISAADSASVSLSSATAKAGDSVTVTVNLNNNPGVISLGLDVGYDTSKLKLTGVTDNKVLSGWSGSSDYSASTYRLFWSDDLAESNNTKTGAVATLTFKVLDGFSDSSAISVTPVSGSTFDKDIEDVNVSASGGKISSSAATSTTTTTTKKTTTTTKKAVTTTKKSTVTTTKRVTTTSFDNFETESESFTDYFDITDFTFEETEPIFTEESTTEAEEEQKTISKTKIVLIVLMVCFAIVGVAIIISIVKKSKE